MAYAGKQEVDWDKNLEPVIKYVIGKKGIKVKQANEVGKKKVDYFRGKDFINFLLKDPERTQRRCHLAIKKFLGGTNPETEAACIALGVELLNKKFIHRAVYQPFGSNQPESQTQKKWPDRLARVPIKEGFDPAGFYIVEYTGTKGMQYFLMVCIVVCVIIGCLFPVWPFWAKIGGWYCVVILSTIYFAIQIIRLMLFVVLWVIGTDFWLLPNLNDDSLGVIDSFRPAYAYRKRKDGVSMLLVRLFCLGFLAIATHEISKTNSLSDLQDLMTGSYEDIIDWGKDRLTALPGRTSDIPSLDFIEEELKLAEAEEAAEKEKAEEAAKEAESGGGEPKKGAKDGMVEDEGDDAEDYKAKAEHKTKEEL